MTRNLVRPLGSTHNFTQSGWLILFRPDHLSGQHKLGKLPSTSSSSSSSELLRSVQTSNCLLFNSSSSSSITPPWGKTSNLWTPCVYSLRPRVPSWILIRWTQYATPHRNKFSSPPVLAMSTAMQNPLRHLATSSQGIIFWRHSRFSPKQPEPQAHGDYNRFSPQTANTTFATLWRTYLPHTINNALT